MATSLRRPWLLPVTVSTIGALIAFSIAFTIAPLWPNLACMTLFGGSGCDDEATQSNSSLLRMYASVLGY